MGCGASAHPAPRQTAPSQPAAQTAVVSRPVRAAPVTAPTSASRPVTTTSPKPTCSAPVPEDTARGFIAALRAEYVQNKGEAVQQFYDSKWIKENIIQKLDPFENQIREARNKGAAIADLEKKWALHGSSASAPAPVRTSLSSPPSETLAEPSTRLSVVTRSGLSTEELSREICTTLGLAASTAPKQVALAGVASEDLEVLRKSLCILHRLKLSGDANAKDGEARLRSGRSIPDDWNMRAYVEGRYLEGGCGGRQESTVIAYEQQPKAVVQAMQHLFDATYRKVYTRDRRGAPIPDAFRIKEVYRVYNDQVWREYCCQRAGVQTQLAGATPVIPDGLYTMRQLNMKSEFKDALPGLHSGTNEVWVFHGTTAAAATGIAENDFRLDLSGSNAGTLYGKGVYLAENVSKADEYGEGPRGPAGEQERGYEGPRPPPGPPPPLVRDSYILLCRSHLGKVNYNDEQRPDPDKLQQSCLSGNCHSVIGDRKKINGTFREIIVYKDDQVYPEFIVHYERIFFHERFAEIYKAMVTRKKQNRFKGPTKEEESVLRSMWNVFGMPNRGKINKWQLLDLLTAIGQPPMDEGNDLDATFKEWDTKKDGWIDWDEMFQEMITRVNDGMEYY